MRLFQVIASPERRLESIAADAGEAVASSLAPTGLVTVRVRPPRKIRAPFGLSPGGRCGGESARGRRFPVLSLTPIMLVRIVG